MATNVLLPQWGMNMEDGTLTRWLVSEGDDIIEGQPLVEVETAKINSELESPASGVVYHIMAAEGSLVKVGELVAVIGEPGENPPRPEPGAPSSPGGARRRQRRRDARPTGGAARQVTPVARRLARDNDNRPGRNVNGTGPRGRITEQDVRDAIEARQSRPRVQVVPRARMLARQEEIDLADVTGSGPNGRITVADVEQCNRRSGRRTRARRGRGGATDRPPEDNRGPHGDERQHDGTGYAQHRSRCHGAAATP